MKATTGAWLFRGGTQVGGGGNSQGWPDFGCEEGYQGGERARPRPRWVKLRWTVNPTVGCGKERDSLSFFGKENRPAWHI